MKLQRGGLVVIGLIMALCCNVMLMACAQTQLVKNLKDGKDQLVVVYGTSLSSGGHGKSWMQPVADYFNNKYGNHLKYTSIFNCSI